jgi:hypothetical protein
MGRTSFIESYLGCLLKRIISAAASPSGIRHTTARKRFQITTDGFAPYRRAAHKLILEEMGESVVRLLPVFGFLQALRVHSSIRVTSAMEACITDHVWELAEIIGA